MSVWGAEWQPILLWTSLPLIGVLLLGAVVIYLVGRWRKQPLQTEMAAGEQLSHFRQLYEQGELSREEYERIRRLLGVQMRQNIPLPRNLPPAERSGPPPLPESAEPADDGVHPGDG